MAKEIERKYLANVTRAETALTSSPFFIRQGYIHVNKQNQVRIRLSGNVAYMCIKFMNDGLERDEYEWEVPYTDGIEIYEKCKYKLKKERVKARTAEGFVVDIDFYQTGLVIAEIELPFAGEPFTKPDYFGEEVTGKWEYSNYHLAGVPKPPDDATLS